MSWPFYVIIAGMGIVFCFMAAACVAAYGVPGFLGAVIFGVCGGLCLSATLVSSLCDHMISRFYFPVHGYRDKNEYNEIHALIANGEFEKAERELKAILEKEPENLEVLNLLVDIHIDETREYEKAFAILNQRFLNPNRATGDLELAFKLVELYQIGGVASHAIEFLRQELTMPYRPADQKRLRQRLSALTGET